MPLEINQIIGIVLTGIFIFVIWSIGQGLVAGKKELPHLFALLPVDIQKILTDAAKFAAEFVEQMDKHGEIDALVTDLRAKSEVKLNLAVDFAVEYLEKLLKDNGYAIDIDQDQLKKFIQKYVWENPELFPSHKDVEEVKNDAGTSS